MAQQDAPKGFFDLPPEIRNKIYEYTFIPCRHRTAYNPVLHYRKIEPCSCFMQPMMRVSQQMRLEAVSLHYSIHEFHFALSSPNKAVLLSWLDRIARDSVSYIRRFQLKRYVEAKTLFHGERIQAITMDLKGERLEMEVHLAGKRMVLPKELHSVLCSLTYADGRCQLSKEKLLEMFDTVGWHEST